MTTEADLPCTSLCGMEVWNLIGAICAMPKWFVYAVFCCFRPITVLHIHDDVIKWKHFPRYWPFVRGIHRSPVNSPHKGQWRGALMFSLTCAWINGWVNNHGVCDLRRHRAHYDVIEMLNVCPTKTTFCCMVLVPYVNSLALIVCNIKFHLITLCEIISYEKYIIDCGLYMNQM